MNIVNSGDSFTIYGEEVKTYKKLPANTYKVCFGMDRGFYLKLHDDLCVDEKIYGDCPRKVVKVMNTFNVLNRNMGIILSGPKGAGKSVFARCLAEEGAKRDMPLIIVDHAYNDLTSFISSIKQECIIVFDEFEKVFDDEQGEQDALLSLFDGIDNGKKLYVITCNEVRGLSTYLLNRPGRFHYHFTFGTLTSEEIRGYLEDNLNDAAKSQLDAVIQLGMVTGFTYDILRAITFELNQGYNLDETLQDLNVSQDEELTLRIFIKFSNGVITADDFRNNCPINLRRPEGEVQWYVLSFSRDSLPEKLKYAEDRGWLPEIRICFKRADLKVKSGNFYIDKDKLKVQLRDQYIDDDCSEELRKLIEEFKLSLEVEEVTLVRKVKDTTKRFFY